MHLGGLISYSARLIDAYRQAGMYVVRVVGGEDPAGMPIVQDTRFELAINLHTAAALGIVIPQDLIVTATQIIE